jgi:hypothetical protein
VSDIVSAAGGGAIGAAFMAGVNWATSYFKGNRNGNGNGSNGETKAREMGTIVSDLNHVKSSVDELKRAANENQLRIGELAGNVNTLTQLITKHFKL